MPCIHIIEHNSQDGCGSNLGLLVVKSCYIVYTCTCLIMWKGKESQKTFSFIYSFYRVFLDLFIVPMVFDENKYDVQS